MEGGENGDIQNAQQEEGRQAGKTTSATSRAWHAITQPSAYRWAAHNDLVANDGVKDDKRKVIGLHCQVP